MSHFEYCTARIEGTCSCGPATSTPAIVAFLNARLDEDERTANAVIMDPWTLSMLRSRTARIPDQQTRAVDAYLTRFDPVTMLAEVAAKRAIMQEHRPYSERYNGCRGCGLANDGEPLVDDVNECPTLRLLSFPYTDHQDYQGVWMDASIKNIRRRL